jgi:invasion protein IalB
MPVPMMSCLVKPMRRSLLPVLASVFAAMLCSAAVAQQPPPKAAPKAPAPKAAPKQQPAPQAAPQAQPQQQQQPNGQLPIVYSPWTKICNKPPNQPTAKDICITVKEARLETGQPLASLAFIEAEGEDKKVLRVTLPLGMQLPQGARAIMDQEQPISGRYVLCLPQGCMADFEIDAAFLGKAKKAQNIVLQGINLNGQTASYPMPLAEFAKANEGPPTDPKQVEDQQRKLQEQLQKRAKELQKGAEGQGPAR